MPEDELLQTADSLFETGEYDRALAVYEEILLIRPADVESLTGMGLCLFHLARFEESIHALRILLKFMPDSDALKLILAESLILGKKIEEGRNVLEKVLERSPDNLDACFRLGKLNLDEDDYQTAYRYLATFLKHNPDHAEALGYMGIIFIRHCRFDEAISVLGKAYALEPDTAFVLNNLGRAFKMMGNQHEALVWFRKALDVEPENPSILSNYLFTLCYCDELAPAFVAQEFFRLAPCCRPKVEPSSGSPLTVGAAGSGKIRVGYVSGDFYTHSVAYFIEPILQFYDRQRYEVYCYSVGRSHDATTDRLITLVDVWREMIATPPEELWRQVREDGIDILVDLSGHTADNRLGAFSLRAAPIQVSWIGCPATTGIPQMDYYLTDAICDPIGMTEQFYTERLVRLPRTFCCYLPPMTFPPVGEAPFLANGHLVFGSFNNFSKVTTKQIKVWIQILKAVPDSKLYLKSMSLGSESVRQELQNQLSAEGVTVDRLIIRGITETSLEHLDEYTKVDIALDTFPYNGTTTTCEALWMGTPVITLAGSTHVSRVGASLLQNAGCSELIASNEEEYIQIAVMLAADTVRLQQYRHSLRGRLALSPLMDAVGVTQEVEQAFETMIMNIKESTER